MPITHLAVKSAGEIGTAEEWNADHVVTGELLNRTVYTLVVAASDSKDTDRADYVCDGTDDEVQINQAITDLPANGGCVVLLEGTYTLGAAITISKNNVSLIGQGRSTNITRPSNNIIEATSKTDLLFSQFRITGNALQGLYLDGCSRVLIEKLWGGLGVGGTIRVLNNSSAIIVSNSIFTSGGLAIDWINSSSSIVSHCYISNQISHGIYLVGMINSVVIGCIVTNCGGDGVYLSASDTNIISSCRCRNNTGWGVNIFNATCDQNLVHGNILVNNTAGSLQDNGTGTVAADNIT